MTSHMVLSAYYWLSSSSRWYMRIYYYIRNRYFDHTHMLRTTVKPGSYSDLVHKLPDALFCAIEDYVSRDGEDAFSWFDWGGSDVWNNALPGVKGKIIEILHFRHIEQPKLQRDVDEAIAALFVESVCGREELDEDGKWYIPDAPADKKRLFKQKNAQIAKMEKELLNKTKKYAKMAIDIHEYLWT